MLKYYLHRQGDSEVPTGLLRYLIGCFMDLMGILLLLIFWTVLET